MSARIDIRALDRALLQRIDAWMAYLGIIGRAIGNTWTGYKGDTKVTVRLSGSKAGAWGAWSAGRTGLGVTGIATWAKDITFGAAIKEASAFLGEPDNRLEREAQREAARARDQADRREAADRRRIAKARMLWAQRRPVGGTILGVHLTEFRGFTAPSDGWPADIAFHPPSRSLILAGRTDAGEVQFVHRVSLTIKGDNVRTDKGKKKKQTDGPMDGAAFRLPSTDFATTAVQHAEGGETAIAAWLSNGYATRCRFGALGEQVQPVVGVLNIILADDDHHEATRLRSGRNLQGRPAS
jgi:hypothetical protein